MKSIFLLTGILILTFNMVFAQLNTNTPPEEKLIDLPGNVQLSYVEQGSTSGIPVILMHGITDSYHSYDQVLPHLPPSLLIYAISHRGHGNSSKTHTSFTPFDFASDIVAFMNEKKIKKAIIAGHSMSSTVAQSFAIHFPERTKALVLIGSFASLSDKPAMVAFTKELNSLQDPIDIKYATEFQQSTLFRPVSELFFKTAVAESMKVPAHVWKGAMNGQMGSEYSDRFSSISVPTLIVWGTKDLYCSWEDQELLQKSIKNSRLLIYDDTGHAIHWEDPVRFAKDLVSFCTQQL